MTRKTSKKKIILVFSKVTLLKNHVRSVYEERKDDIYKGTSANTFIFPLIVSEDKIGCKTSVSWLDIDDLIPDLERIQELLSEENDSIADKLHEAMDLLPFTGNILDVYIELCVFDSLQSEHSYQLFGALRRLKDWHNAVITFVQSESCAHSDEIEIIQRLLTTRAIEKEDFLSAKTNDVIWRGKMSIIDKTINRGFILPGFSITQNKTRSSQVFTNGEDQVLGRMLEMLDEVYIPSIPLFYFTGLEMQLSLLDPHPQSRAMMEVISNMNPQCGYLCRLAYYSDESDVPSTADKYLNTSSWKESIISDITFVQEPEEEILRPFEFMFFLLTKSSDKSNALKFHLHVMKSASQISGFLSKQLLMRTVLNPNNITTELTDDPLQGLPILSSEVLSIIKEILQNEQKLDGGNPSIPKDVKSAQIADMQERILEDIRNSLPLYEEACDQDLETQMEKTYAPPVELQMDPSEWPEKKYLLYQESQRKSMSRLRSTDSLVLSSPIQSQEDTPPSLGIKNCLKLFQSDGTAVCQDLSPIRKKNTSRSQGKLSKRITSGVTELQWPDCLDQRAPDIYYNKDKKTEKVEEQCNRIRDRYVTTDTYSSCSSPLFVVNKKPKELGKYVEDMLPKTLRRSPRKAVRGSAKGMQSLGVRSSPRKLQKKGIESQKEMQQSPTKKGNKQFSRLLAGDSQRRQSLSSVEIKKIQQTDNIRRKSLTAIQAPDTATAGRRESRSERHRRKLEEIVTEVVQKHGVHTEDSIYKACVQKLFRVTKLFVMDLPNSQNLRSEMKNIAEGQVKQVVDLEKRKQKK